MELPDLIEAMRSPAAYSHPITEVMVCQTHISVVFLAGPFVYKVKKPVSFGFLDFSTLEKRRHYCDEEVRLNRRLAPDVYLGVVPLARTDTGAKVEGNGEVVEWAVKMHRLPEEATLEARLDRGEITAELVETFACRIASFHRSAAGVPASSEFGRFEAVAQTVRDIFTQSVPQVGTTVLPAVFDRLRARTEVALAAGRALIEKRAEGGMIRDTHGDLHLDHVYYFPDRQPPGDLTIIDCIEFNERFRFTDVIADMAFPYMDFAFHGRRDLAQVFADAYLRAAGDSEGRALLPLYAAYRAAVRGSVEGLKLAEAEIAETERAADFQKARAHWLLALGLIDEPVCRPCLILVGGLPGSGKSTLARGLEHANCLMVRSDVVRKELAHLPVHEHPDPQLQKSLYGSEWNERTYDECLRRAEDWLFQGKRVVVDATFREEKQRKAFLDAAARWGVPAVFFLCRAEPETVRARLANRRNDASDADWSVHVETADRWENFSPSTRSAVWQISTEGGGSERPLHWTLELLREMGLQS